MYRSVIRMGTGQATEKLDILCSPRLDILCSVLLTSVGAVHGCVIVEHLADSSFGF